MSPAGMSCFYIEMLHGFGVQKAILPAEAVRTAVLPRDPTAGAAGNFKAVDRAYRQGSSLLNAERAKAAVFPRVNVPWKDSGFLSCAFREKVRAYL